MCMYNENVAGIWNLVTWKPRNCQMSYPGKCFHHKMVCCHSLSSYCMNCPAQVGQLMHLEKMKRGHSIQHNHRLAVARLNFSLQRSAVHSGLPIDSGPHTPQQHTWCYCCGVQTQVRLGSGLMVQSQRPSHDDPNHHMLFFGHYPSYFITVCVCVLMRIVKVHAQIFSSCPCFTWLPVVHYHWYLTVLDPSEMLKVSKWIIQQMANSKPHRLQCYKEITVDRDCVNNFWQKSWSTPSMLTIWQKEALYTYHCTQCQWATCIMTSCFNQKHAPTNSIMYSNQLSVSTCPAGEMCTTNISNRRTPYSNYDWMQHSVVLKGWLHHSMKQALIIGLNARDEPHCVSHDLKRSEWMSLCMLVNPK